MDSNEAGNFLYFFSQRKLTEIAPLIFVLIVVSSIALICFLKYYSLRSSSMQKVQEDNQVYMELNLHEQELYFQSRDYLGANPYISGDLTLSQKLVIEEKGIRAWEFVKDNMLTNNDLLVIQKSELNFFKKLECSVQTNLPMPTTNEVYYFESKIHSLPTPEETMISIGIGIKPYPWFRLPGRHPSSVSYDSDGHRRRNEPFPIINEPPFPKLIEGDVVGIGYKTRSGTVFFTRNGKRLSESRIGGHIKNFKPHNTGQIFPIIGANNLCSIHVNLGQQGFVFIEGNIKKWGFAPLQGSEPAPPAYNPFNSDILLERSDVDDVNDLEEREDDFPPDFLDIGFVNSECSENFGTRADLILDDTITMNTLDSNQPPQYEREPVDETPDNTDSEP